MAPAHGGGSRYARVGVTVGDDIASTVDTQRRHRLGEWSVPDRLIAETWRKSSLRGGLDGRLRALQNDTRIRGLGESLATSAEASRHARTG